MVRASWVCLVLGIASPAWGQPTPTDIEDAADHHVSAQGNYRAGLPNSWEYRLGSGSSGPNITGIAAHGLLAAYKLTHLKEHRDAGLRAARSLISAYDRGWKDRRPYTQDIEFLAAAGFVIDAGRWFRVTRGRYTPLSYLEMVTEGRRAQKLPSLVGWDIASAIRASLAVGQHEYARGLIAEILRHRNEWDRAGQGPGQWLARGSLLWALAEARDRAGLTPEQTEVAESLVREVVVSQRADGGWQENRKGKLCTQTTAYSVLGLNGWGAGRQAAAAGRDWLRRVGRTDAKFFVGGRIWATNYELDGRPGNDYNGVIQSEAMMALASER